MFTSVINFFKNIPIPDLSILAMFFVFLGFSKFALTLCISLMEVLQTSFRQAQNVSSMMCLFLVKIII